jgi:hypothetical protein
VPVPIVTFEDFYSPFCKRVQATLTQLVTPCCDRVRLVHEDFPIDQLHPQATSLSHLQRLQEMVELLESRGIPHQRRHSFSADGEDATPGLAVRDVVPAACWLLADTRLGQLLQPRLAVIDTC